MAPLTSASVTVVVNERRIYGTGKKRRNRCTITFGDGASTYPTGGVPMPAFGSFGLIRQLDFLNVLDQSANGFLWKYNATTNTLMAFVEQAVGTNTPLVEASTALAPASASYLVEAVGW